MIWVTIILDIITELPQLISLIKAIIAAIHGQASLTDKLTQESALQTHLLTWRLTRDHAALETGLKALAGTLGVAVP
jgi:hypothetical protein